MYTYSRKESYKHFYGHIKAIKIDFPVSHKTAIIAIYYVDAWCGYSVAI